MTKLKSGPHICADKLLMATATQHVSTAWLRKGNEAQVTLATASNIIHLLKKYGGLVPAGHGKYIPRPDKIESYYKDKKFNPAQKRTVQAVRESTHQGAEQDNSGRDMFGDEKKEPASLRQSATSAVHPDIDVINSLLDAIALAEPVLQKYKRMCEAAHS